MMVEFCASVALSVVLGREAEPVWGLLVAPASDLKSETILAIRDWPDRTVYVDDLTTNALLSASPANQHHASILNNVENKVVLIKDLTTLLSKHEKEQAAILGQLRTAYDGEYNKHSGTLGVQSVNARFGFLGGGTQAVEAMFAATKSLGERFLMFRCKRNADVPEADEDRLLDNAWEYSAKKDEFKEEFTTAMSQSLHVAEQFVATRGGARPRTADAQVATVKELAKLVVKFRNTPHVETPAVRCEMAPRIMQQLRNLADAHAMLDQRTQWDESDMRLVRRVACDTVPLSRMRLVRLLAGGGWVRHSVLRDRAYVCGDSRLAYIMEQWCAIGVVRRQAAKGGTQQHTEYRLTDSIAKSLTESEMLQ